MERHWSQQSSLVPRGPTAPCRRPAWLQRGNRQPARSTGRRERLRRQVAVCPRHVGRIARPTDWHAQTFMTRFTRDECWQLRSFHRSPAPLNKRQHGN